MSELTTVLEDLKREFLTRHTRKEDLFWETKMGLSKDPLESQKKLSQAEIEAQSFIQDASKLKLLRDIEAKNIPANGESTALKGWINFFAANAIEDKRAQHLAAKIIDMEGELQAARGEMDLGYIDPATGKHTTASSNLLANIMRMEPDEKLRKAAFEGLRSIEPFVLEHGFLEIVKKRNELGRMLGYEDYYDMKVRRTEGFSKKRLFELLDDLEQRTREHCKNSVESFVKQHGELAREPWNFGFLKSGDLSKAQDPYLPFSTALDRWVRSFAAMNIKYRGATLTLDLIDRKGKYENGFMHGPIPSFFDNGKWNPAKINFTANAMPNKVGAGFRALETLFHEGGHAAHFSNVLMNAPCFGQEFAPTSVAYAETQSMFLDSILSDADWQTRYAKDAQGNPMPWDLIEKAIRMDQPFETFMIRAMLIVCYAEKALYEMSDSELTSEKVLATFRRIEQEMHFLTSGSRPVLAVPHLLAGESSAYYHGYVLAEMAVHQTRHYFSDKYGHITDNAKVGPELAEGYWAPGNSQPFMDLVARLTGKPFSADALVNDATRSIDDVLKEAKSDIERAKTTPEYEGPFELDANISVVHGNELITSFRNAAEFPAANEKFVKWVEARYPANA